MAGALKRVLSLAVAAAAVLAAAGAVSTGPALAQTALPDPTRPPAALEESAVAVEAKTGKGSGVVAQGGLQTVIMRKGRKPVAVINGTMVELGGKLGDATLVEVGENEVVLQGPQGREVLHLTPSAEKQPVHDVAPGPGGRP